MCSIFASMGQHVSAEVSARCTLPVSASVIVRTRMYSACPDLTLSCACAHNEESQNLQHDVSQHTSRATTQQPMSH